MIGVVTMDGMDVDLKLLVQQGSTQSRAVEDSQPDGGRAGMDLPALLIKSVDVDGRRIRVLVSSASLDRHGERILPEAFWDSIGIFMSNPVVCAAHAARLDNGEPPVIGSVVKLWIDKAGLWAIIRFAETDLAEKYWQLYKNGHMKAISVGFLPMEWEDVVEADGSRVRTYTRVELLEISCVAVPSNRDALVKSNDDKGDSFVSRKRRERIERRESELAAQVEVDFPDEACREFAEALLCGEYEVGKSSGEAGVKENEFVGLISGEPGCEFAELVRG